MNNPAPAGPTQGPALPSPPHPTPPSANASSERWRFSSQASETSRGNGPVPKHKLFPSPEPPAPWNSHPPPPPPKKVVQVGGPNREGFIFTLNLRFLIFLSAPVCQIGRYQRHRFNYYSIAAKSKGKWLSKCQRRTALLGRSCFHIKKFIITSRARAVLS